MAEKITGSIIDSKLRLNSATLIEKNYGAYALEININPENGANYCGANWEQVLNGEYSIVVYFNNSSLHETPLIGIPASLDEGNLIKVDVPNYIISKSGILTIIVRAKKGNIDLSSGESSIRIYGNSVTPSDDASQSARLLSEMTQEQISDLMALCASEEMEDGVLQYKDGKYGWVSFESFIDNVGAYSLQLNNNCISYRYKDSSKNFNAHINDFVPEYNSTTKTLYFKQNTNLECLTSDLAFDLSGLQGVQLIESSNINGTANTAARSNHTHQELKTAAQKNQDASFKQVTATAFNIQEEGKKQVQIYDGGFYVFDENGQNGIELIDQLDKLKVEIYKNQPVVLTMRIPPKEVIEPGTLTVIYTPWKPLNGNGEEIEDATQAVQYRWLCNNDFAGNDHLDELTQYSVNYPFKKNTKVDIQANYKLLTAIDNAAIKGVYMVNETVDGKQKVYMYTQGINHLMNDNPIDVQITCQLVQDEAPVAEGGTVEERNEFA